MNEPRARRPIIVHPDRRSPKWLMATVVVGSVAVMAVAGQSVVVRTGRSPETGLVLGAIIALLMVLGLFSLPMRTMARACVFASAIGLVRFGFVGLSFDAGAQGLLLWAVASVITLVGADRLATAARPLARPVDATGANTAHGPTATLALAHPLPEGRGPNVSFTARSATLVAAVVLVASVLFSAGLGRSVEGQASPGDGPQGVPDEGSSLLRSSDELDMTTRPDLTDEILLTVRTDRDSFMRGEIFDRWDGRRWYRSDGQIYSVDGGEVLASPDDLGALGSEVFTQRVRVEATYADIYFGAASVTGIDTVNSVAQRLDGTLVTWRSAMGRGSSYTVTVARPQLSQEKLRSVDSQPVPEPISNQYASPPVATDRVIEAARQVVTNAGAVTTYDKIIALEEWMGSTTEYSLDAPLSPKGVDVVDHFLFESQEGWCEQIASSLVVLARANGIPARLVTGYVATERDRVSGEYLVRARDAHAWTEVWFPEVGWVPFDPTADVPLAASTRSQDTWGEWLLDHLVQLVVGAAVLTLVGWAVRRRVRRWWANRQARPTTWAAAADWRLAALAARAAAIRLPQDTATALGRRLAERYDEPGLAEAGQIIDDALFAEVAPSEQDQRRVDALLDALADAEPVEPVGSTSAQ